LMLGGTGRVKATVWIAVGGQSDGDAGMREVGAAFGAIRETTAFLSGFR
jgi:hypothetical protein